MSDLQTTAARDKVGSNPAGSNPAAEPNFHTTKFRGIYLPMKVYYIKMWGMFLAGIWFAQFLRWAVGGFHV